MAADPDPDSPALLEAVSGASPQAGERNPRAVGLALGAAAGAGAMVVTSEGDALLLGILLGVAASDVAAGTVGVLAGVAVLGRWGSTSLAAAAGGQAVIGPAGLSGSTALVVSAWGAAAALVLVAPRSPNSVGPLGPLAMIAFGLTAAALVAGPATGGGASMAGAVGLRVGASVLMVTLAWVCSKAVPFRLARPVSVALAALSAIAASL